LIFLCVWLFRRYGEWPVTAIAWALFGLSFVGQYRHAIGIDTNLTPLYAFPIGILLHFKGASLAARLSPSGVTLAALVSSGLFLASAFFKPSGIWTALVECISAATLVTLVAYRVEAPLFTPLDLPIVRFYGRISYSFYLLHPLSLWTAARLTSYLWEQYSWLPVTLILAVSFLYSLIFTTPLAYVSWRYVERPALKWRSAHQSRGAPVIAPSSAGTFS
jgi:peptidoglycan/LPS O-acetylase OafA/YrhL